MRAFYASKIGPHRSKTPEGYLVATSIPIARTGYQDYKASEIEGEGDEIVRVYRSPEEVFHPATIASFEGKSIATPHPPQFLTAETDAAYARGHAQNIRRGSDRTPEGDEVLLADLVIKEANLIDMIENHTREELSCGYACEWVPLNDEHSPVKTYAQRNIRGNHIAVVPSGRAGEEIRILDHAVVEKGEQLDMLENVLKAMGWKPPTAAVAMDAGSEAVQRNEEKNSVAEERAEVRNKDEVKPEEKPIAEGAKAKPQDAEPEEAAENKEIKKVADAMDAMDKRISRLCDAVEKLAEIQKKEEKMEDAGCTCGADSGEEHKEGCAMYKAEDSELIPVETLTGEEKPKNPIPGAPKSNDRALDALLKVKAAVAATRDPQAINDWNSAYRELRGARADKGGYDAIARRSKPEEVKRVEELQGLAVTDRKAECSDFEANAKKFHRKNAQEVSVQ
jgi:hypothetical protein